MVNKFKAIVIPQKSHKIHWYVDTQLFMFYKQIFLNLLIVFTIYISQILLNYTYKYRYINRLRK